MERIFRGRFRIAYLVVKTAALYAGTLLVCYFWPQLLNYLVDPPPLPALETLALLPPVGFLVLGACLGRRLFLVHLALLMAAAPVAYWTSPSLSDDAEALARRWVYVLIGTYVVGAIFGAREQLRRYGADPDA